MNKNELKQYIENLGGVASTAQLAAFYGVAAGRVRAWAQVNRKIPLLGNSFAFTLAASEAFGRYIQEAESVPPGRDRAMENALHGQGGRT